MYRFKPELRIPGPVPVPSEVSLQMAKPVINHRGAVFKEKFPKVLSRLQGLFETKNPIYMITGSGTSGMEAAVSNLVSPGTPVLCLVGGFFGKRWADLCAAYKAEVHTLEFPWDRAVDPDQVKDFLADHPQIELVFMVQNESSTAVLNDVEAVSQARGDHQALLVVDAVSALGGTPCQMDARGLDVVVSASQKCLMTPPGTAFIALSERARAYMEKVESSRYYFDLRKYEQFMDKGETPFTPNIHNVFALEEALMMMEAEGLDNVYARHMLMRDMMRAGARALDLELLVSDADASPTVTAVKLPQADEFRQRIREKYGVEFAGGQGIHAGQIFRVGHMGYATPLDVLTSLAVLEIELKKLGKAVEAAERVLTAR
ncbi:MAG TPA: alanine--glyoxylate aminotransferase family protein [Firmicutes bacterium]|jgi:aspartate aminotransferase-like enzyme|nr:alanine--glyoxylate aminotransferase family protein [Bacillota bacterium]HHT42888.1 alanine--glyoxylate aminotransferase family protein [Bacillota bacterium]